MDQRPDLVQLSASICKYVYDAFIEHLNSVFKHLLPTNTALTPELVKRASAVVKPRWAIRDRMGSLLGTRRTSRKPEILQDRERIRSPSFKPTLDKTADFIIANFKAIINDGRSSSTGDVFEDKAAVGFSWLPSFVEQYRMRLQTNKWPRDVAAKQAEAAASRTEVETIKAELTLKKAMHEAFGLSPPAPSA
mmetsp:Transcript_15482/g.50712  ORF Transcript_15482/g.50712 Transcript_15482/m.50712 type:complete len:192 (-) Transcript_15482:52-627(-)